MTLNLPPLPSPSGVPPRSLVSPASGAASGPATELPRPRREAPAINAVLWDREDLTPDIARFHIRPDAGVPAFAPGQYLALGLPVNDGLLLRPYSAASAPGNDEEVEFLIRRLPHGALTPALWQLSAGDRIHLGRPKGLFRLAPAEGRTAVLVATGTGLGPFISMVRSLLSPAPATDGLNVSSPPRVLLVHGVAQVSELAYREQLEAWAAAGQIRYVPVISRPADPANAGWAGAVGRLPVALGPILEAASLDAASATTYLCGHPEMIAAVSRLLSERGFAPEAILSEHYWVTN